MAIRVEESMDEKVAQESGEKNAQEGGEKNAREKNGALAKKYRDASRLLLPRAIFMMMVFGAIVIFMSSLFMGAGISVLAAFAPSGNFLATIFFLALELLFVFCAFVLHYGLFLSNLRFVRNQPVAVSFLLAGFRQRRAKKFASFFIVPLVLDFMIAIVPLSLSEEFVEVAQIMQPQALLEYLSSHPQIMRMMIFHSAIFFLLALAFYFPFAFVWPHVYDEPKNSFSEILSQSLKFWKGRFLKFLGFEIAAHYKTLLVIFASGALEFFILGKFSANAVAQIVSSLFGFVSFCATILFFASVILSINFFYDEFASGESKSKKIEQVQNENSLDESSN